LEIRNYQDGDEVQIVKLLNLVCPHWGSVDYWRFKYKYAKGFDPRLIFLMENKGKVVSCTQYIRRDLKFDDKILESYVGGDGATHPEYAGKGLFSKLLSMLYDEVRRRKGCFVYGYNIQPIYKKFYRKRFGEVALHRPLVMIKILNLSALAVQILPLVNRMLQEKLRIEKGKTFTIRLELTGQTTIDYRVKDDGITLDRVKKPDINIKTDPDILLKVLSGKYSLLRALIFRKIVISVLPSALIRLLVIAVKMRL